MDGEISVLLFWATCPSLGSAHSVWARHWGVKDSKPRRAFSVHTSANLLVGYQKRLEDACEIPLGVPNI